MKDISKILKYDFLDDLQNVVIESYLIRYKPEFRQSFALIENVAIVPEEFNVPGNENIILIGFEFYDPDYKRNESDEIADNVLDLWDNDVPFEEMKIIRRSERGIKTTFFKKHKISKN